MAGLAFIAFPEGKLLRFLPFFPLFSLAMWAPFYIILRQYLFVRLNNYCLAQSAMGPVTFGSTMRAGSLMWIYLTNILAIIFSLGLFIPWAKVRRTRYILGEPCGHYFGRARGFCGTGGRGRRGPWRRGYRYFRYRRWFIMGFQAFYFDGKTSTPQPVEVFWDTVALTVRQTAALSFSACPLPPA